MPSCAASHQAWPTAIARRNSGVTLRAVPMSSAYPRTGSARHPSPAGRTPRSQDGLSASHYYSYAQLFSVFAWRLGARLERPAVFGSPMPLHSGAPKADTGAMSCSGLPLPALSSTDASHEAAQPVYRASSPPVRARKSRPTVEFAAGGSGLLAGLHRPQISESRWPPARLKMTLS